MHLMPVAFALALASAGRSMLARMAMIAMTTSNSIKVNPAEEIRRRCRRKFGCIVLPQFASQPPPNSSVHLPAQPSNPQALRDRFGLHPAQQNGLVPRRLPTDQDHHTARTFEF